MKTNTSLLKHDDTRIFRKEKKNEIKSDKNEVNAVIMNEFTE